ncbi:MAG: serine hydrolase [Acidobacteria bacterium]|nr:MAG: serine hydrolase [Acidobacteriota bacterium]
MISESVRNLFWRIYRFFVVAAAVAAFLALAAFFAPGAARGAGKVAPPAQAGAGVTAAAGSAGLRPANGPAKPACARRGRRFGPRDPKELGAFLDPIFSNGMAQWHIPGAVFLLVRDGRVVFAKGYGYSDLSQKTAVEPDTTVFRAGSVSKLFTATAVLDLVERGQLDLHTDVNRYLQTFQLPENFSKPVTLANLLTHTGGFDDRAIGIAARNPRERVPLGEYLARSMPPRVRPPGELYSYSSHGIALAGYIVETVSHEPFEEFVETYILEPLAMRHSSFSLEGVPATKLARGYIVRNGAVEPVPYDAFNIGPAVGLNSTASDMAHFMIANLEGGVYQGRRLLPEPTLREMQRQQYTDDPRLPGRTFGYYEKYFNGWRAIGHGGNIRGFGSLLLLVPEAHLGIFLSMNLDEPRFEDEFLHNFFDHYFPPREAVDPPAPNPAFRAQARKFEGSYRINPYTRTSLEKLATLYWQYRLKALPDGTLELHSPRDYTPPTRWVEVGPLEIERADGEDRAVFRRDGSGRITALLLSTGGLEKLAWYETTAFQVRLVKILLLIFLSFLVVWPLEFALRRLFRRPMVSSWSRRLARLAAIATGVSAVVFIVGFVRTARAMDLWDFTYGVPAPIQRLLVIPPFTALGAFGMLVFDVRAWRKVEGTAFDRLYYTFLTAAAIGFVWFLGFWNLVKV